jgi:hypothetical protein
MALQAFPLPPAGGAGTNLMEITPKNFHKFPVPPPAGSYTPAYVPTITYKGGAKGDDVSVSSANSTDSYSPRTQAQKAGIIGVALAVDVTTPRGWIDPLEPYGAAPAAPGLTSAAPNTAVVGTAPVEVTLTGTGFSPYSMVKTGGVVTPFVTYVSPTQIKIIMHPESSVAGPTDIVVVDHGLSSPPVVFTFTAP